MATPTTFEPRPPSKDSAHSATSEVMSSEFSWQLSSKRRESYPDHLGKSKRPPPPKRPSEPIGLSTVFPVLVLPLAEHKVRWFYCEPGKYWQPFEGRDSLALEAAHRKVCSVYACHHADKDVEEAVEVMGEMYEVCVQFEQSSIKPIYWSVGKPWKVMRGTWFEVSGDRWFPIPEKEAKQLEEEHCRQDWREKARADKELQEWANSSPVMRVAHPGSHSQQQPADIVVLHKVSLDGYDALWVGDSDVMKVKQGLTTKLFNTVGEKVTGRSQSYGTTHLVRGYKEPSSGEDCLPPIGHIVFVVHGIGQNMESADIVKSTSDLRCTCMQVAKKRFPGKWSNKRVEFLPVEWRTWLSLDGGVLAGITPHGVKALRNLINDSFLDTMYYMSPRYGPEMLDGLRWQLHKLFDEFIRRHPCFVQSGGSVSLFGHSLGSVMCYDLLHETACVQGLLSPTVPAPPPSGTGAWNNRSVVSVADQTDSISQDTLDDQFHRLQQLRLQVADLAAQLGQAEEHKKLKFRVNHLFAVGSPLALFIMMREHATHIQPHSLGAESFLPSCICCRIHNLHHPSDPVAYRLEPLVNPLYAQIKPVKVDSASSKCKQASLELAEGPRTPVENQPTGGGWWSAMKSIAFSAVETNASKGLTPDKLYDNDSQLKPEDRLRERLDFMLREGLTENSYVNTITAHTCYWTSQDCVMYLLLQLYSYQSRL